MDIVLLGTERPETIGRYRIWIVKQRQGEQRLDHNLQLVVICKTFDGGEFVDAMLASVYKHAASIVFIHSETSWLGERGNTVRQPALEWCEQHDLEGKTHHVSFDSTSQESQYDRALSYIKDHRLPCDAVWVVDADEIWEDAFVENAIRQVADNHKFPAFRSNMHVYLKSPFYQVSPPHGSPTVFLKDPIYLTRSPRGCAAPAAQLDTVWMHHLTGCRFTRADVERKIHQSCLADKCGEKIVRDWMATVYDRLPAGEHLHYFQRHRRVWGAIKKLQWSDLPPAIRAAKNLALWLPVASIGEQLLEGEINAIQRLCTGRKQAVDLGTYRGLSACVLAMVCDRVHTVDCYRDLPADSFADTLNPKHYEQWTHTLEENRELFSRWGNVTAESARTAEAAELWTGGMVDVLFVDADHSEESVLMDVSAWRRHMKPGGLILLHDANSAIHPGVRAAVQKLSKDSSLKPVDCGPYSGSLAGFEVVA